MCSELPALPPDLSLARLNTSCRNERCDAGRIDVVVSVVAHVMLDHKHEWELSMAARNITSWRRCDGKGLVGGLGPREVFAAA